MRTDYTEVFSDPAVVDHYAEQFHAPASFASTVSARQRQWLRGFISEAFEEPPDHHDFGCGTGRVMRMLDGAVRHSHGYDCSAAMLAKARQLGTPGSLHLVDSDEPPPAGTGRPAVVTVFRVLLNAPAPVRDHAMDFAAGVLTNREAGLLILENHGNTGSIRHLRRRAHADSPWFGELAHSEITALLRRHGFTPLTRQGFSLVTPAFYQRNRLSRWVVPVDDFLARRRWSTPIASNLLYVARRR